VFTSLPRLSPIRVMIGCVGDHDRVEVVYRSMHPDQRGRYTLTRWSMRWTMTSWVGSMIS
jgi:hypothetical protein